MSSNLDGLLDFSLPRFLHDLETEMQEFRNRQPASGRSGVQAYIAQNSGFDYTESFSTGGQYIGEQATFTLLFTGDGTQDFPIENPFVDIFVNTTDEIDRVTPSNWLWTDIDNNMVSLDSQLARDEVTVDRPLLHDRTRLQWYFQVSVYGDATLLIKGYAVGTSPGTITLTRVS